MALLPPLSLFVIHPPPISCMVRHLPQLFALREPSALRPRPSARLSPLDLFPPRSLRDGDGALPFVKHLTHSPLPQPLCRSGSYHRTLDLILIFPTPKSMVRCGRKSDASLLGGLLRPPVRLVP